MAPVGLVWALGTAACAHTAQGPKLPTDTAEGLYAQGRDQQRGGLYQEPLKTFGDVKAQYPYSRFAALAELRIADVHLEHNHHLEAIDAYRNFLRFHPTHTDAPYALSRVGEAYFAQIPRDWWFLPPSAEKEQDNIRQAITAYQDMLARYDAGELAEVARGHLAACRRKLAEHELYVARFYSRRHRHKAARLRAEALLADFDGLGLDAEALWIAAQACLGTGDTAAAQTHLRRLSDDFGDTPFGRLATARIKSLQSGSKT
jgi:outer membrane protein assembly factor BamD